MEKRPPIVAVLGHVDHGKTSLLDAIRNSNIQSGESGGITQHIGAYQIEYQNQPITFIDTPGHAAFSKMRARGGKVADLAILVVAADDGVMPQTIESISHITTANIPFIVAINKVDLPDADPLKVKIGLTEKGVYVEGFGGNTPVVEVSATKRTGLDLLFENLLLMAELADLKADKNGILEAVVIESNLDKNKGPLATVIVKNGQINLQDTLSTISESHPVEAKVKSLKNWLGQDLKTLNPSDPALILGFEKVPEVGSTITHKNTLKESKAKYETTSTEINLKPGTTIDSESLPIILKSDVVGTQEAILGSLPESLKVIYAGTGAVSESDVLLADTTKALIVSFRVSTSPSAKKLASTEKVTILTYDTIYELLEELEVKAKNLHQEPEFSISGQATIKKVFFYKDFTVYGAVVNKGQISQNDLICKTDLFEKTAKVVTLKQGQQNANSVTEGVEFGFTLNKELDIKEGDTVTSIKKIS